MPNLKRYLLENQCYHSISSTRERAPLFADDVAARIVIDCLRNVGQHKTFVLAYALMPDHLHLLLVPREPFALSQVMQSIKGYSSRLINERRGKRGSVWERSYYDRVIRSERHLRQAIEYIHHNPVAAGIAAGPEDYPYSSAHCDARTDIDAWMKTVSAPERP